MYVCMYVCVCVETEAALAGYCTDCEDQVYMCLSIYVWVYTWVHVWVWVWVCVCVCVRVRVSVCGKSGSACWVLH